MDSIPPTPHNLTARPSIELLGQSGLVSPSSDSINSIDSHEITDRSYVASPSGSGTNTPMSKRSRPILSACASTINFGSRTPYFASRRKRPEDVPRPWLNGSKKDKRIGTIWHWLLPVIGATIGIAGAALQIWRASTEFPKFGMCPVLDEDFSSGTLNPNVWSYEVETGGFGNGEFEMTTSDSANTFFENGNLIIKPTLQDESLIDNNNVINLLGNGCTSDSYWNCVTSTNTTNGTIVNPVKSARINTKKGAQIKFGRVEVEAKLPAGDWLWPAIWMLPTDSVYGEWPASGEIDLMESRGNNYTYTTGGNNVVHQTTHWGPNGQLDKDSVTTAGTQALHSTFADGFHTFGLQWTEKYLFTYVDTRIRQILYQKFDKPQWDVGHFPPTYPNGTATVDPWTNGTNAAPFDQNFYLILNLAVGGTNGWFMDGVGGKPWTDGSDIAKLQFWEARNQWLPTWKNGGQMEIKSVKMWQKSGYNGCNA